jgi:hypothetical protein
MEEFFLSCPEQCLANLSFQPYLVLQVNVIESCSMEFTWCHVEVKCCPTQVLLDFFPSHGMYICSLTSLLALMPTFASPQLDLSCPLL